MHDHRETVLANVALMIHYEHAPVKQTAYCGRRMRMTDITSPRRRWVHGRNRLVDVP